MATFERTHRFIRPTPIGFLWRAGRLRRERKRHNQDARHQPLDGGSVTRHGFHCNRPFLMWIKDDAFCKC